MYCLCGEKKKDEGTKVSLKIAQKVRSLLSTEWSWINFSSALEAVLQPLISS